MPKFVRPTTDRSVLMARVRQKHTAPEWRVRRLLFSMGYRYRLHGSHLPGRPDILFAGRKKAIFVHGCFWHGHDCSRGKIPKSNQEFWSAKIKRNRCRDRSVSSELRAAGWSVMTVWECMLRNETLVRNELVRFLGPVRRCP